MIRNGKSSMFLKIVCGVGVIFTFMVYNSSTALAQNDIQEKTNTHSLEEKDWALQFEIDHNFTLTSFQGSIISAKYQLNPNSALRLGMSLDLVKRSEKDDEEGYGYYSDGSERKKTSHDIKMVCQYLRYPKPESRMRFFYGAGPVFQYGKYVYTRKHGYPGPPIDEYETKSTERELGISLIIGAEWFVRQNLSLLAEYGVEGGYRSEKTSRKDTDFEGTDDAEEKEFFIRPIDVKFGISIYF